MQVQIGQHPLNSGLKAPCNEQF